MKGPDNDQIDFVEVAKECGIVSKGAAYVVSPEFFIVSIKFVSADKFRHCRAKRYERMMKAHSIGVDMTTADGSSGEIAAAPRRKRKRTEADTDDSGAGIGGDGSVEGPGPDVTSSKIKVEPGGHISQENNLEVMTRDNTAEALDTDHSVDNMPNSTCDEVKISDLMGPQIKTEPQ